MSTSSLSISATGMVTSVGLDTRSTCAAIRCGLNSFRETYFRDTAGQWIQGAEVEMDEPWRGPLKLAKMLAQALNECVMENDELDLSQAPILLCVAERDRPGRIEGLGEKILSLTQAELGVRFRPESRLIELGRSGAVIAIKQAVNIIHDQNHFSEIERIVVAGVDSFLNGATLRVFEGQDRLLTSENSNGFIPGEAASAIVLEGTQMKNTNFHCLGLGFGVEEATILSEKPLRADGLTTAIIEALTNANIGIEDIDFRIADVSGEQYWFKEAALALGRLLRVHKEGFEMWHPADAVGEVGAAIGGVMIASMKMAFVNNFAPGKNVLHQFSNDDGQRAAAVFSFDRMN